MITCPVCRSSNTDLSVKCLSCGAYLQGKVDALDLFATVWKIIESPEATFKQIALATHKNYVFFLGALFGIAIVFFGFWLVDAGDILPNLFLLLLSGLLAGPVVGIGLLAGASLLGSILGRKLGGEATLRNTYAVIAYATIPIILSLLFIFPVEVGIFGLPLFSSNPPASVLKPGIYFALMVLNGIALLWTFRLLVGALSVVNGIRKGRALLLTTFIVAAPAAAAIAVAI